MHNKSSKLPGAPWWKSSSIHYSIFVAACILSSLLVFIPQYPPMVDLPQHAGQIALIKAMQSDTFAFRELLDIQFLTPYWFGYSIIYLLSIPFGILTATKLTVALALAGFPLCADRFLKSQGANPFWSWLLIPAAYGFAFEWGLLNFLVATPVGFWFLSQLKLNDEPYSRKDFIKLAVLCHILFFAHVLVMAVSLTIASLLLHRNNLRAWLGRLLPLFSVAPLFLVWFTIKIFAKQETNGSGPWSLGWHRLVEFLPGLFAMPVAVPFIFAAVLICILVPLTGHAPSRRISKIAPFGLYVLIMLLGPNYLFGTFFVYNRFSYIGLPLFLIMFTSPEARFLCDQRLRGYLNTAIVAVAITLIGYQAVKIIGYSHESAAFQKIIQKMEPDQRVLGLVFTRHSAFYTAPTYLHYPVWYQATHSGLVDFNFASFFPQVVRYTPANLPPADPNFVWMPHMFQWGIHEKYDYTYFVIKNPEDISQYIFPHNEAVLIENSGDWWLYRNTKHTQTEPPSAAEF